VEHRKNSLARAKLCSTWNTKISTEASKPATRF
jgi:hypothetical protein